MTTHHHEILKPFTINYDLLGKLVEWQNRHGLTRNFGIKRGLVRTRPFTRTIKPPKPSYCLIDANGNELMQGRSDVLSLEKERLRKLNIFTCVIDMNNVNYRK